MDNLRLWNHDFIEGQIAYLVMAHWNREVPLDLGGTCLDLSLTVGRLLVLGDSM